MTTVFLEVKADVDNKLYYWLILHVTHMDSFDTSLLIRKAHCFCIIGHMFQYFVCFLNRIIHAFFKVAELSSNRWTCGQIQAILIFCLTLIILGHSLVWFYLVWWWWLLKIELIARVWKSRYKEIPTPRFLQKLRGCDNVRSVFLYGHSERWTGWRLLLSVHRSCHRSLLSFKPVCFCL